jgi:uncharacterized protein (TIGR02147 family)
LRPYHFLFILYGMNPNKEIFLYSNYREFLRDYYLAQKKSVPKLTFRLFAQQAGFSSASFQKLVMDGKKNLTMESILKISRAVRLNKKAGEYFKALVFFNQVKTLEEKKYFLKIIDSFRKKNKPEKLLPREYDYLKEWYHCVIREMVDFPDFKEDPEYINKKLFYAVKPDAIRKSLEFLLGTGFLVRDQNGKLTKKDKTLATGDIADQEMLGTIARAHHCSMIDFARKAASNLPREERSVSNTTLGISAAAYAAALKRIEQLRMEILEIAAADPAADRVFQLNVNLFPLTKRNT